MAKLKSTRKKTKVKKSLNRKNTTLKKAAKKLTVRKPVKKTLRTSAKAKRAQKKVLKIKKPIKTYLTQRELNHFKDLILQQKTEILENAKRLRDSLVDENTGEYVGDNSTFSMHMAEQGSDEMEREKAYLFMQRDEKYLGYLEDALERIEKKTYGICIECIHEPKMLCKTCPYIPKDRLEVVPVTQHCVECKSLKSQ